MPNKKESRFSVAQKQAIITAINKENLKGVTKRILCKQYGICLSTYTKWASELKIQSPSVIKEYTEEQKLSILEIIGNLVENGTPLTRACEHNNVAPATYLRWKEKYLKNKPYYQSPNYHLWKPTQV